MTIHTISMRAVATVAALTALGALTVSVAAAAAPAGPNLHRGATPGPAAVPGEIVVGYKPGVRASERTSAQGAANVHLKRHLLARGVELVKVDGGQTVSGAIQALRRRSDVRYAEPNWIYQATSTTPNDPLFGSDWGLNNTGQTVNGQAAGTPDADIDAPEAWDRSTGSASTVVAVVDTGVAYDHPDLAPNMWSNPGEIPGNGIDDDGNGKVDDVGGWDFVDGDNNPWDYNDHGTHVAGTIAARGNNGIGVAGVAWQASIMPLRVLNALGSGSNANITDAFTYAGAKGAKVVNASLGGPGFSQAMSDAITNNPNTLFVVSAGNGGSDGIGDNNDITPSYPCNYTAANLICVAATDNNDALAGFSNYGATSVDLAAPGVNVDSTRPHYTDSFSDGFESGLGKWTVDSGNWTTASAIGTTWLVDTPPATFPANTEWAIRTASTVDVGTRTDCVLRFTYGTFLQAGVTSLYAQSSTDRTTWTTLSTIGDTNGAVKSAVLALGAGSRYYRFRVASNASTSTRAKVYIDNVRIACPGGTYGSSDYQFLSGTSMASPHVAGAAAVLFSAKPSATVAKVKAALLNGGDPIAALTPKTVSGRRLNLNSALTLALTKDNTTTTITKIDADSSLVGQPVMVHYSVAVAGPYGGTPTGEVTVSDGTDSCTGTVAAGQCAIALTTAGTRSLTATYQGDDDFNASPASAAVSHQVDPAGTTTTIASDAPDPSDIGRPVSVTFAVTPVAPGAGTPTGDVVVTDGVDNCRATVAAGGCEITLTTVGERTLVAFYTGDGNFTASRSADEAHTVTRVATTTAIVSYDPEPSVVGQPVTVGYSVISPGDAATGNVTVSDGTTSCTATVAAGQCSLTFASAGVKVLTASYGGDAIFDASTSTPEPHAVDRADTATTITSDKPATSVTGEPVTVEYDVTAKAPGAGTPTGEVTVSDGKVSCTAPVEAGQCELTFTSRGTKSLTATYTGDPNFNGSDSAAEPHTVEPAGTTTTIIADDPDPSAPGDTVGVQYVVAAVAPGGGTPTGDVTVSDGVDSCTATVAAGVCDISLTTTGQRTLTAVYAGDSDFNKSVSADETHTVNPFASATAIVADAPEPSVVGQKVTVEYSVSPGGLGTPTGDVIVSGGTASCIGTVAGGRCSLTFTTAGAKLLTARYAGDTVFAGSTSAVEPHTVNAAATTTTITSHTPGVSVVGQPVTVGYEVAVNAPGAGTPTGDVTVSDGVDSCTGTVAARACTLTLSTVGTRALRASYAGDSDFNASSSATATHTVNGRATTTTITADNPDPSVVGQPVSVQYSVTAAIGTPTGKVTVSDGGSSCTATVADGRCTLIFATAGGRRLTASYAGGGPFNASTSAAAAHTVNPASTTTVITAAGPDPSIQGGAVTVRYAVRVNAPGAGSPTGNVTVGDGVDGCTATVAAGQCTLALRSVGARTLFAGYAGNPNYRPSASAGVPHTVLAPLPPLAHVTGTSQTHRRFRVSPKPRLAQASRARPPIGTTFRYTLDHPATVRLDFTQPGAGRNVKGRCVAPTKRNQRKPKCTRARGTMTFSGHPGVNSVRFKGWLTRTKKLTPGKYTLTVTAITPTVGTTAQKLKFTIVR